MRGPGRRPDIWQDHLWGLVRNLIFNDRHEHAYAIVDGWAEFYIILQSGKDALNDAVDEHHENQRLVQNAVHSVTGRPS